VLAGGRNSRMNFKVKALLKYEGETFLERTLRALKGLDKFIMTNTPEVFQGIGLPMYPDSVKDIGPMGGIYTALKVSKFERCVIIGCDMPFITEKLVKILTSYKEYDMVVPRIDGKFEMLCAMYSKNCIPVIERLIKSKQYKLSLILEGVRVKYIDLNEEKLNYFTNINTPEEYKKLVK